MSLLIALHPWEASSRIHRYRVQAFVRESDLAGCTEQGFELISLRVARFEYSASFADLASEATGDFLANSWFPFSLQVKCSGPRSKLAAHILQRYTYFREISRA